MAIAITITFIGLFYISRYSSVITYDYPNVDCEQLELVIKDLNRSDMTLKDMAHIDSEFVNKYPESRSTGYLKCYCTKMANSDDEIQNLALGD